MDDLFSAFDAPAAASAGIVLNTDVKKLSSSATPSGSGDAMNLVGRKRPRSEVDVEAVRQTEIAAPIFGNSENVDVHGKTTKRAQPHDVGDAIAEASHLDLDPKRNERVVDFAVAPPEEHSRAQDSADDENNFKKSSRTSTRSSESVTEAGIGDALKSSRDATGRLMRGEVDESKTTAPTEAEADAGAASRTPAKVRNIIVSPFDRYLLILLMLSYRRIPSP
jgi:hypothetical protein